MAVEDAIDAHYAAQIEALDDSESALREAVTKFRAEELEHRDIARDNGAEQAFGYRLLTTAIRVGCRVAIAVSQRI